MITYQEESFKETVVEAEELYKDHYQEIARNKDFMNFNPYYEKYFIMEEAGMLHFLSAREDGKLIGYFITFIMNHIHYRDHLIGINDILYIHPNYRKGSVGIRLIKEAEKALAEKGVEILTISMKIEHSFAPIMERLEYTPTETSFEKVLRRKQ